MQIHLQTAIVKEDSVSRQSGIDYADSLTNYDSKGGQCQPSIYYRSMRIHLLPAIVKGDNVSCQSSIDLF
jgi:hypothetical protein